jgi:hypothetical protein
MALEGTNFVIQYGYLVTCLYDDDAPEDEGTVFFNDRPKPGDSFLLPSSGHTETWEVVSFDEEYSRVYAKQVKEVTP